MLHLEKRCIVYLGKLVTKHLHTFSYLKDTFMSDLTLKVVKLKKNKCLNTFLSF